MSDVEVEVAPQEPTGPMTMEEALQEVLKKSLIHDGARARISRRRQSFG